MTAFKASLHFFLAPSFDKRALRFQTGESPGSDLVPFDNYRKFTFSFFSPRSVTDFQRAADIYCWRTCRHWAGKAEQAQKKKEDRKRRRQVAEVE